ncbi:MAG: hypothetical protein V3U75_13130 [Methylococcaceae bacterium]
MIREIYWKAKIFFLALRWIPQINLGDLVWYQGGKFIVCNGTRYESWRLDLDNGDDGWVKRKECKKVWTWNNIKHSFLSGWNFYMTSWFQIWCQSGVKIWMKNCKIWPWPCKR